MEVVAAAVWKREPNDADTGHEIYVLINTAPAVLARVWGSGSTWWAEVGGLRSRYYTKTEALQKAREDAGDP